MRSTAGSPPSAARLDLVGVVTVAMVSGLGGGIIRDILLGALPPATFSDWRYLAAAAAGGLAALGLSSQLVRLATLITVLDAAGLGLFAVTGASKALGLGLGAAPGRHSRRRFRRRRGDAARCAPWADPVGAAPRAVRHPGPVRRGDHSSGGPRRDLRAARRGRRRARVLPHSGPRRPLRPERPDGPGTGATHPPEPENESRGPGRGIEGSSYHQPAPRETCPANSGGTAPAVPRIRPVLTSPPRPGRDSRANTDQT